MVAKGSSTNKRQQRRPGFSQKIAKPMGICSFCMGDEDENGEGIPEEMIHCGDCGNSGHPSCLRYSEKLVEKIKTTRWQCLDCKRCFVCRKGDDSLLFCDLCDAAIHPQCCNPPLHNVPKGEFVCDQCRNETPSSRTRRQPANSKISRPVAQLIDGMSKFFLPSNKNHQRQQSIQKAMKFLRTRKDKLARSILLSSKSTRPRRKPNSVRDERVSPTTLHKNSIQSITLSARENRQTRIKRKKTNLLDSSTKRIRKENIQQTKKLDLSKYKSPPAFLYDRLPENIIRNDVYIFLDSRENSWKMISQSPESLNDNDPNNIRWPPYIVFADQLIKTWFCSSYPQEYARVPRLFICEFCLKYMKCSEVYQRHRKKCSTFHPPANEIYHKDELSVFEVDGNINRIYCQNLCLLAKLFLDHKTLYYDVEPFLFYVLTRNDADGCHFLGYFSKEKHCPQKYNLSCIMVLPNCQRRGYGRFLIELSYLLSRKENQIGTPERPLSTHGAQTYEAYWKKKIVEVLLKFHQENRSTCRLNEFINETGIDSQDIVETLQKLGVLTLKSNDQLVVRIDVNECRTIVDSEKIKHGQWVSIDPEFLRFAPVLKPFFLSIPANSTSDGSNKIEVIFQEIPTESTNDVPVETNDRPVRRRKFRRKRRSMPIKARLTMKNESNIDDDEHSQEYIARRPRLSIDESMVVGESSSSTIDEKPIENLHNESIQKSTSTDLDQQQNQVKSPAIKPDFPLTEDSFKKQFTSPLPFKKRAWASALIDPPVLSNQ